ncbi:MAG: hypothetical protein GXO11_02060 [Epsilonproteobacteria bacterium]|nr:hypothetical protein [Campylobacterota bacterium]
MVIVQTNPDSKILEIDNSLFNDVKAFLKQLSIQKHSKFSYIDEFGDKIEVIDGKEYVVPTVNDIKNYSKDDFIDEDELKKVLGV